MNLTPVVYVMTRQLTTLSVNSVVSEAVEIFKNESFHHIPIINEDGSLAGMLSRTDVDRLRTGASLFHNPRKAAYDEALFQTMWVRDVMTKEVVQIAPTDTIACAYATFKKNKFRALPVIKDNELKGILTPLDILEFFFEKVY